MSKNLNYKRVAVVTFTIEKAALTPLYNLIDILLLVSSKVYPIIPVEKSNLGMFDGRSDIFTIIHKGGGNTILRLLNTITTQLKITYNMLKLTKKIDIFIFFLGGQTLFLPILLAKITNRKILLLLAGSSVEMTKFTNDPFNDVLRKIFRLNMFLSDNIIVYSPILISQWGLDDYKHKILIAHEHFINLTASKGLIEFESNSESNKIGYVGRLSSEKGVMNLIRAIPNILCKYPNLKFLIVGDGKLKEKIIQFLSEKQIESHVEIVGWVSRDKIPYYLKQLKLLVIPSYTEGLPNVMLESMASKTIVLSSPAGAIPEIIKDGKNGFIMENNSPKCIEKNIIRVLEYPDLNIIRENGYLTIQNQFSIEKARSIWEEIIS